MVRQSRWVMGVALAVFLVVGPAPAVAQGGARGPGGWQFEVTPYAWLAGVSGDVGLLGAPPVSIDARFRDIVSDVDFAAMLLVEARRERWGVLFDAFYLQASKGGDTPGPVFGRVDVETELGVIGPSITYRVLENGPLALDVLGGARVWFADTELRFGGGVLPARRFRDNDTWADPVLGARLRGRLSERWFATLLADVGGFGLASDLTWQAFAGVGYQISETWSAKLGYRALGVDYESDGFTFDVIQHGFVLGVGIHF